MTGGSKWPIDIAHLFHVRKKLKPGSNIPGVKKIFESVKKLDDVITIGSMT